MITIASALVPNGCDVIASLPVERAAQPYRKASTPPILDTPYSILCLHICTFAQAEGRFALLHFSSRLHPLHSNTPPGDFFDFGEGDGRAGKESGEGFGVAFATGRAAEPRG